MNRSIRSLERLALRLIAHDITLVRLEQSNGAVVTLLDQTWLSYSSSCLVLMHAAFGPLPMAIAMISSPRCDTDVIGNAIQQVVYINLQLAVDHKCLCVADKC